MMNAKGARRLAQESKEAEDKRCMDRLSEPVREEIERSIRAAAMMGSDRVQRLDVDRLLAVGGVGKDDLNRKKFFRGLQAFLVEHGYKVEVQEGRDGDVPRSVTVIWWAQEYMVPRETMDDDTGE